jgi:SAM-dependent methyltransferase
MKTPEVSHDRETVMPGARSGWTRAGVGEQIQDTLFWLRQVTWNRLWNGFDRVHGTHTGGEITLARLGVRHPAVPFGGRYQAIEPGIFRDAMRRLESETDLERFTFVDLGCGKGRALLLAEEFGFREILGVELSPVLAESARKNLAARPGRNARVLCQDAGAFEFPPGDLVVYLFSPFRSCVFRRMLHNLCRSVSGDIYMVYINPVEKRLVRERPCFALSSATGTYALYRHLRHGEERGSAAVVG